MAELAFSKLHNSLNAILLILISCVFAFKRVYQCSSTETVHFNHLDPFQSADFDSVDLVWDLSFCIFIKSPGEIGVLVKSPV